MKTGTLKKIAGILWLTLYIFILFASAVRFGSLNFSTLKNSVSVSKETVTKNIVNDESASINVVDMVSPSVVSIVVKTTDLDLFNAPVSSQEGIGTGFIVDAKY